MAVAQATLCAGQLAYAMTGRVSALVHLRSMARVVVQNPLDYLLVLFVPGVVNMLLVTLLGATIVLVPVVWMYVSLVQAHLLGSSGARPDGPDSGGELKRAGESAAGPLRRAIKRFLARLRRKTSAAFVLVQGHDERPTRVSSAPPPPRYRSGGPRGRTTGGWTERGQEACGRYPPRSGIRGVR